MEIPNTQVIRHWIAWGPSEDCPDELIEHDADRVEMFQSWLTQMRANERANGQALEKERIINLLKKSERECPEMAGEYVGWFIGVIQGRYLMDKDKK